MASEGNENKFKGIYAEIAQAYSDYKPIINPKDKDPLFFHPFAAGDFASIKATDSSNFVFADNIDGLTKLNDMLEANGITNKTIKKPSSTCHVIEFELDGKKRRITYYSRKPHNFTPPEIKDGFDVLKFTNVHKASEKKDLDRFFGLLNSGGFLMAHPNVAKELAKNVRLVKEDKTLSNINVYQKV